jgi:antitoxin YefM
MLITRSKGKDVVILSKSDFDSMEETFYLLKSPKNAERLLESIKQLEAGKATERALIEE